MILSFRVKNYRSLRDECELSLVAVPTIKEHQSTHSREWADNSRVLHSILIYGPNASGKSNLLYALHAIRMLVVRGARDLEEDTDLKIISPFKLDPTFSDKPSEFGLSFISNDIRYEYHLGITKKQVETERLEYFPKGRKRLLFKRVEDRISPGADLRSSTISSLILLGQRRTKVPFLSLLGQNEEPAVMPAYQWFSTKLRYSISPELRDSYSKQLVLNNPEAKKFIIDLLCLGDFGIRGLSVQKQSLDFTETLRKYLSEVAKKELPDDVEKLVAKFQHSNDGDETSFFAEEDESMGTLQLFALAGPLFDVFRNGRIMILDELDSSLHPDLVSELVKLFNTPEYNKSGAQLIANTHDVTQLDLKKLRRDSIWFTEKSKDGATDLFSLAEFSIRKDLALQKNYLEGRFGALPALGFSLLQPIGEDDE